MPPNEPSFKATVSVEFGYSNTHSFTASVTKRVKFPALPHSIGFVWNIVTEYILHFLHENFKKFIYYSSKKNIFIQKIQKKMKVHQTY